MSEVEVEKKETWFEGFERTRLFKVLGYLVGATAIIGGIGGGVAIAKSHHLLRWRIKRSLRSGLHSTEGIYAGEIEPREFSELFGDSINVEREYTPENLLEDLDLAFRRHKHFFLSGPPCVGKTHLVNQAYQLYDGPKMFFAKHSEGFCPLYLLDALNIKVDSGLVDTRLLANLITEVLEEFDKPLLLVMEDPLNIDEIDLSHEITNDIAAFLRIKPRILLASFSNYCELKIVRGRLRGIPPVDETINPPTPASLVAFLVNAVAEHERLSGLSKANLDDLVNRAGVHLEDIAAILTKTSDRADSFETVSECLEAEIVSAEEEFRRLARKGERMFSGIGINKKEFLDIMKESLRASEPNPDVDFGSAVFQYPMSDSNFLDSFLVERGARLFRMVPALKGVDTADDFCAFYRPGIAKAAYDILFGGEGEEEGDGLADGVGDGESEE